MTPPNPLHPTWMLTKTTCSHLSEDVKKCSDEFPISYRLHFTTCRSFKAKFFFEKNVGKKLIIIREEGGCTQQGNRKIDHRA